MPDHPFDSFDTRDFFDAPPPRPPVTYPRVYLPSRRWKLLLVVLGLALALPSAYGVFYFGSGHEARSHTAMLALTALSFAFFLLGLYCVAAAFKLRLILYANAIEQVEPLRTIHIDRVEIGAYRFRDIQGVTHLELLPGSAGGKKHRLSIMFDWDEAFYDWFEDILDADEVEYDESVEEVEADAALGATPEARLARAGHARKVAGALSTVALLLPVATLFVSHPALLLTLIVLPWLAIVLRLFFGVAFTLAEKEHTARGDLSALLFMPGVGLGLIALQGVDLLDWTRLIPPTVVGTALMLGIAAGVSPELRRNRVNLVVLPLLLFAYPASLLAIANVQFDHAPAQNIVVNVTGKHHSHDKLGTHYHLAVAGWGSAPQTDDVEVGRELYQAVKPGEPVCIHRHPGRLNMAWYEVAAADACYAPERTASR